MYMNVYNVYNFLTFLGPHSFISSFLQLEMLFLCIWQVSWDLLSSQKHPASLAYKCIRNWEETQHMCLI